MMTEPVQSLPEIYALLSQKNSNVVKEILPIEGIFETHTHYPLGEISDKIHHTTAYYHSHSSHDPLRLADHGHFHIFLKKKHFEGVEPLARSEKNLAKDTKDSATHVISISMNAYGFPIALFTLNHWVIGGRWHSADAIIEKLDNFILSHSHYNLTSQWITQMMTVCHPLIVALLQKRDEILHSEIKQFPKENIFQKRDLEILSLYEFP